jgi:hypothetical protein
VQDVQRAGLHGAQRQRHVVRVVVGRDDQDRCRQHRHDLPRRFDPVQERHLDVHHHDRRPQCLDQLDGLSAVRRLTDHREPRVVVAQLPHEGARGR